MSPVVLNQKGGTKHVDHVRASKREVSAEISGIHSIYLNARLRYQCEFRIVTRYNSGHLQERNLIILLPFLEFQQLVSN